MYKMETFKVVHVLFCVFFTAGVYHRHGQEDKAFKKVHVQFFEEVPSIAQSQRKFSVKTVKQKQTVRYLTFTSSSHSVHHHLFIPYLMWRFMINLTNLQYSILEPSILCGDTKYSPHTLIQSGIY